jgi:hypothetical protein
MIEQCESPDMVEAVLRALKSSLGVLQTGKASTLMVS